MWHQEINSKSEPTLFLRWRGLAHKSLALRCRALRCRAGSPLPGSPLPEPGSPLPGWLTRAWLSGGGLARKTLALRWWAGSRELGSPVVGWLSSGGLAHKSLALLWFSFVFHTVFSGCLLMSSGGGLAHKSLALQWWAGSQELGSLVVWLTRAGSQELGPPTAVPLTGACLVRGELPLRQVILRGVLRNHGTLL